MTAVPDIANKYRTGMCDAFALAVNRRTGWPLALWVGHYPDDDGEPGATWSQPAHAVVCEPGTDRWFDVDGWHQGTPETLLFIEAPTAVELVRADVDEVAHAFAVMEGVSESMIEQADQDLTALGLLMSHRASRPRLRKR